MQLLLLQHIRPGLAWTFMAAHMVSGPEPLGLLAVLVTTLTPLQTLQQDFRLGIPAAMACLMCTSLVRTGGGQCNRGIRT